MITVEEVPSCVTGNHRTNRVRPKKLLPACVTLRDFFSQLGASACILLHSCKCRSRPINTRVKALSPMKSGGNEKCQKTAWKAGALPLCYARTRAVKVHQRLVDRQAEARVKLRHAAWRHDGVRHAVKDLLIGRANGGQDAAEFGVVAHHEIIRAEAYARVKRPHFIGSKSAYCAAKNFDFSNRCRMKGCVAKPFSA